MTTYHDLLEATGLSRKGAASLHGVSPETVRSWVTGRRNVPPGALKELERLLQAMEQLKKQ